MGIVSHSQRDYRISFVLIKRKKKVSEDVGLSLM